MTVSFVHSGNCGDIISALAGIKTYCDKNNSQAVIYLRLNTKAFYYPGATHPVTDNGEHVMLNEPMYDMIKPLLLSQSYVSEVKVWKGEKVTVNLDKIRGDNFVNMPFGALQKWYGYVFPDLCPDLSKAWIDTHGNEDMNDKIIINRTSRYTNPMISYYFLRDYEYKTWFAGTEKERDEFCKQWDLNLPYLRVHNFYELAQLIKGCEFFIGNQSMCYNIAEAMKVPRILEACSFAPNCIPVGEKAYDFYQQEGLEYYFNELSKQLI